MAKNQEKNVKNENVSAPVVPVVPKYTKEQIAEILASVDLSTLDGMKAEKEKQETEAKAKRADGIKASVQALCVNGITSEEVAEIAATLCGKTLRAVGTVNPEKPRGKPMALRNRVILAALAAESFAKEQGGKGFALGAVSADRLAGDIAKVFPLLPAAKDGESATAIHPSEIKAIRARIKAQTASLPSSLVALDTFKTDVETALKVG